MVKRAMIAGLNGTGCHVRDLRVASPAVTRFTTRDTRAAGGVHVCAVDNDPQSLEIHFYDSHGIDLSSGNEKKVERLYFRQEFRRAFFEEIGEILYPPRALEYYNTGLTIALDAAGPVRRSIRVVADMGLSPASFVLPSLAASWGIDLISMRAYVDSERPRVGTAERDSQLEQLSRSVDVFQAGLGISMDSTAERVTLVTGSGRVLDHDTALHAMVWLWCHTEVTEGEKTGVAVPVTASSVIDQIGRECGREVRRTGTSRRALSSAALDPHIGFAGSRRGGYVFSDFLAAYDAVMSFGMLLRMLDHQEMTLDQVVDLLPDFHLRHEAVFCPFDRKGAVMRTMAAIGQLNQADIVEGVRISTDDGWALVLPHATEAIVHVYAEGSSCASADRTLATYVEMVEDAITNG
ncbi:hypothetical protein EG835_05260, partial [bacterium]|nr:hypothetical protein [bacterium]